MWFRRTTIALLAGVTLAVATTGCNRALPAAEQRPRPAGDQRGADQRGPRKWWQDEKFKAELRLTPEQTARIEEIFQASFPKLRAGYEDLNGREEQLSSLISASRDVTEDEVTGQADQVEAVRGSLSKTRILMLFRMRRVLSPEQRTRLQALQRSEHDRQRPAADRPGDRR